MHTIIHPCGDDDTPAIASALCHEGSVAELISGCTYTVGALKPPNGSTLVGFSGSNYTDPQGYNSPRLIPKAGASCLFDFSAAQRSVTMIGLTLDGLNAGACAISAGSCHLTIDRLYIVDTLDGIGGAVGGGSAYTYVLIAHACKFIRCSRYGLDSPIDSELASCIVADCGTSVYARPGANANRINGGRYEWPKSGENFRLAGSSDGAVQKWTFGGGVQLDRAATCSIFLRHAYGISFGEMYSDRPGRAGATGHAQSTHIYCEDSSNITVTGVQMWAGPNDDGTGVFSPAHAYQFKGVNRDIILCGGSVTDGYTSDRAIDYIDGNTDESMPGHRIMCVGGLKNFHR